MRRFLFMDGLNSITHIACGIFTPWYIWLAPIFIIYEILDHDDINLSVDLAEYIVGLLGAITITSPSFFTGSITIFVCMAFVYHFNDKIHSGEKTIVEFLFNK